MINTSPDLRIFQFENIEILQKIGMGGSSEVFKIYHKGRNRFLSLKICHLEDFSEDYEQILIESSIITEIQEISISNILHHYGVYRNPNSNNSYLLETELGSINLNEMLQAGKIYTPEEVSHVISNILSAFIILETKGIAHRDVKSENILLISENGQIAYKIYDFGISARLPLGKKMLPRDSILGYTKSYASPEVLAIVDNTPLAQEYYNPFKADVYSLGVIMLRMLGYRNVKEFREDPNKTGKCKEICGILEGMLENKAGKRLGFSDVLEKISSFEMEKPQDEQKYVDLWLKKKEKEFDNLSVEEQLEKNFKLFDVYFKKLNRLEEAKVYLDKIMAIINGITTQKEKFVYAEAKCNFDFGKFYELSGNFKESEVYYQKALNIFKNISGENSNQIAQVLMNLGNLYLKTGDFQKSEQNLLTSLKINIGLHGENHFTTAITQKFIGVYYQIIGKFAQAEEIYLKALLTFNEMDIFEGSLLKNSEEERKSSKETQFELNEAKASIYHHLGNLYLMISEYGEAEINLIKALNLKMILFGKNTLWTAETIESIAVLELKKGQTKKAEELMREAFDIKSKLLGEQNPEMSCLLGHMAMVYSTKKEFDEARKLLKKAWEIRKQALGEDNRLTLVMLNYLGSLELKSGNFEKAYEIFSIVLENRIKKIGFDDRDTSFSFSSLGRYYMTMQKYQEAKEMFQKSLDIRSKIYSNDADNRELVYSLENLGNLYFKMGDFAKSLQFFEKVLIIWQNLKVWNQKEIADTLKTIGILHEKIGLLKDIW